MKTYVAILFCAFLALTGCSGMDACDCVQEAREIETKINQLIDEGKEDEAKQMEAEHDKLIEKCDGVSEEDFQNCGK